jgi:hypothetical protein
MSPGPEGQPQEGDIISSADTITVLCTSDYAPSTLYIRNPVAYGRGCAELRRMRIMRSSGVCTRREGRV